MNKLRKCTYRKFIYLFHGWFQDSDGDQTHIVAIIENLETGHITRLYNGQIEDLAFLTNKE